MQMLELPEITVTALTWYVVKLAQEMQNSAQPKKPNKLVRLSYIFLPQSDVVHMDMCCLVFSTNKCFVSGVE